MPVDALAQGFTRSSVDTIFTDDLCWGWTVANNVTTTMARPRLNDKNFINYKSIFMCLQNKSLCKELTHWGSDDTHMHRWTRSAWHRVITWNNAELLSVWPWWTNCIETWFKMKGFHSWAFEYMSSGRGQPFCLQPWYVKSSSQIVGHIWDYI